jgi:hypothetical protein
MKKAVFFLFIFLLIPVFSLFAQPASAKVNVCQLAAVSGTVEIESAGGKHAGVQGEYLKEGDAIKTGAQSFAVLSYDPEGKNTIQISANSEMKIMSIRPTDLSLKVGQLIAKLNKMGKGETFEISTPVCVAAVRGTFYSVGHTSQSDVAVFDRSVEVFNLDNLGNLGSEHTVLPRGRRMTVDISGRFGHIGGLTRQDRNQRETFDQRSSQINFQQVSNQNPPPNGTSFEKARGGSRRAGSDPFRLMDDKPGNPNTTDINEDISSDTRGDSRYKHEDSHYLP